MAIKNVFPVALPKSKLPVLDYGAWRQGRFRDVPVLQRAPVHVDLNVGVVREGNVLRLFP